MDTIEAIRSRRSIKHYDPEHEMTAAEIEELMSLAMLSPTAFNIQHWRFVLVRDVELRRAIRAASWDQAQVTDASLLVILCADLKAWAKEPDRYWRNATAEVRNYLVPAIDRYYRNQDRAERDEAIRSCGIAAQTLMLAAKAMGYDSCPMDGFDFDAVSQLVGLPDDHVVVMFVVIGKALKQAQPRAGQLPVGQIVFTNRFPD